MSLSWCIGESVGCVWEPDCRTDLHRVFLGVRRCVVWCGVELSVTSSPRWKDLSGGLSDDRVVWVCTNRTVGWTVGVVIVWTW